MLFALGFSLVALVAIVGMLMLVASMRPTEFQVKRSVLVDAPAAMVFEAVNAIQRWEEWSPYSQAPGLQIKYSGPYSGIGACGAWAGGKMGVGSSTIVASAPPKQIEIHLDMKKPMRASNRVLFTFETEDGLTRVTWAMSGRNGVLAKLVGMVMNIEGMLGDQFDDGLSQLKRLSEARVMAMAAS